MPEDRHVNNGVLFSVLEGSKKAQLPISEMYWGQRGWTSNTMNGMYVGCPELPDGSELS